MLLVARVSVDEMSAESASLATGTEQRMAERKTLAACIPELERAAETCDGELSVVVQALLLFKICMEAGEYRANTAELGLARCGTRCSSLRSFSKD